MNIAKIHVWKVPVLLYGDLADRVLIYIHGQGGRKEEAESFAEIATNYGWQVISVDLPEHGERKDKARFVPWEIIPELQKIMKSAKENWKVIGIYACSIGAYFSIQAFQNTKPDICLLVSPVLDMEDMISNMMLQAQVTEEQLKERQEIKTETGVVLSCKYLCWVREHPVKSICKETNMSLGAFAMLPSIETICLEGIDPDVMEDDWANLGNSNLTILVPEDTSDEQLEAIGRKFLSSMIITDGAQVKRGTCSMPEDPMPDIAEMLSAYGI